jgi:AcrR family transcriptional regulator
MRSKTDSTGRRTKRRDSTRTRQMILLAAQKEFARAGYGGARIENVVAAAKCNIRMLYHYFGSKKGLYLAVLEHAYKDLREQESILDLDASDPLNGILSLYDFTAQYFASHPEFAALLTNENLMRGKVVLKSKRIPALASPLRHALEALIRRGEKAGTFRKGIDPVQLYVTIAALSWFHIAYVHTLSAVFHQDISKKKWKTQRSRHAHDILMSYLRPPARKA